MARPAGYTLTQIRLHWIIVLLVAAQYLLHDTISEAWDVVRDGGEAAFHPLIAQHVLLGALVGLLTVWRLTLRLVHGVQPPPDAEHKALKSVAHATHWAFYVLLILLPVSGAMAWFGGFGPGASVHNVLKIALLALTVLHILAALYHQFVLRTNLMARMKRPMT